MRNRRILTFLVLVFCLLLHCVLPVQAAEPIQGSCGDNLVWTLSEDGVLTISGTGPMRNSGASSLWYKYRDSITSAIIEEGVTSIGTYAFSQLPNLTRISIPGSVSVIGNSAFYQCTALAEVTMAEGLITIEKFAFLGSGLVRLQLPESVTTVGDRAFSNCSSLEYVYIPEGLTQMGTAVFFRASALKAFDVSPDHPLYSTDDAGVLFSKDGSTLIQAPGALSGIYAIPQGTLQISENAFYECCNLTGITFPESLTAIGNNAFSHCAGLTEFTLPGHITSLGGSVLSFCQNLKSVTVSEGITAIGAAFFQGCSALTEVLLPQSLASIGSEAFAYCYSLSEISIPNSVAVLPTGIFSYCRSLSDVYLGSGIAAVEYQIFSDYDGFARIHFSGDAPQFDSYAFQYMEVEVYYPIDNPTWTRDVFLSYGGTTRWYPYYPVIAGGSCGEHVCWTLNSGGELVIQGEGPMEDFTGETDVPWYSLRSSISRVAILNGVTEVGDYAFFWCTKLKDAVLPATLQRIGQYAFDYCPALTGPMVIPSCVTEIEEGAFLGCAGLTRVEIPGSVKTIGTKAFHGCYSLTAVYMAEGLETIGIQAFALCTGLEQINLPSTVTKIGEKAFSECRALTAIHVAESNPVYSSDSRGVLLSKDGTVLIQVPGGIAGSYRIPGSVRSVGSLAFSYCSGLTQVQIPNSVTEIQSGAFFGCTGLTALLLPDSVRELGMSVFADCTHLQSVVLSANLSMIPDSAFLNCQSLATVIIPDGITSIEAQAFQSCQSLATVYIPDTVTAIGLQTFWNCTGLTDVHYSGTKAQWNAISIKNGNGLLTSATRHYRSAPRVAVTMQPENQYITEGDTAVFTVSASGSALRYQWFYSADRGTTWKKATAAGNKTPTLTVPGTVSRSGYLYRCQVTDGQDNTVLSESAVLSVLSVTAQPAGQKVIAGNSAVFSVRASGEQCIYQWQYRTSSSGTWKNATAAGNKTATLTVPGTTGRSGWQYRCTVTDPAGNTVTSKAVYLYVLGIRVQPENRDITVGGNAQFSVSATGHLKSYQWQYRTSPTGTWKNATVAGNTTATLSVPATSGRNGYQYRCRITDSAGNMIYTRAVSLYVLSITAQPVSQTAAEGSAVTFAVTATGRELCYRWEYSSDAGATWHASPLNSASTAKLRFTATAYRNGMLYRCVITDAAGNAVITDTVILNIR